MVDLDCGFLLFKFNEKVDYYHVLMDGPWVVMNHYLTVRKWKANFKPSKATETNSAIWLRLLELPIEYYDEKSLFQIAKRLGKPQKTDITTATSTKGKYARVCVEVDLSKPLIPAYEYEFLHSVCFKCGTVGHISDLCRDSGNGD